MKHNENNISKRKKITGTNLFCEKCSLQFGKRIVYDIHLSFVHNTKENKEEKLTENHGKIQDLGLDYNSKKSKKEIYKF